MAALLALVVAIAARAAGARCAGSRPAYHHPGRGPGDGAERWLPRREVPPDVPGDRVTLWHLVDGTLRLRRTSCSTTTSSSRGSRQSTSDWTAKGGGFYSVSFGFNTKPGVDYTVHVHYRVPYALDETTIDGEAYRVLEWSPIEWSLDIGEQVVTFILPIELPADVTQPEQVTDALVDESGLRTDDAVVASFDRWVYYPTPDETSGKNWLSVYVSKEQVPPRVPLPAAALPAGPLLQRACRRADGGGLRSRSRSLSPCLSGRRRRGCCRWGCASAAGALGWQR